MKFWARVAFNQGEGAFHSTDPTEGLYADSGYTFEFQAADAQEALAGVWRWANQDVVAACARCGVEIAYSNVQDRWVTFDSPSWCGGGDIHEVDEAGLHPHTAMALGYRQAKARSLSVGDVVMLVDESGTVEFWAVAAVGFTKVHGGEVLARMKPGTWLDLSREVSAGHR